MKQNVRSYLEMCPKIYIFLFIQNKVFVFLIKKFFCKLVVYFTKKLNDLKYDY